MHFSAQNHPRKTFPANQDAFLRPKSSLQDISCRSGCIPPPKIIPARHFLQIRMHFSAQNHPCQTFSADQDAFRRPKSSLPDIFCELGCILPSKIIPAEAFLPIRMHSANEKHLADIFGKSVFSDFVSSRYCYSTKNPYINILPHKMPMYGYFCCFNQLRCQPASQAIVMESGQQCRLLRHEASASYFLQCIAKNTCRFPAELLKLQIEPALDFICRNRAGIREYRMLPRSC